MQGECAAERRHHFVHGTPQPLLAEYLGDVGAVMRCAEHAPGPVVLDLPAHQLLEVVGALGGGEFCGGGIGTAGGEMLPIEQQRALADRGDAFGGGGLETHRRVGGMGARLRIARTSQRHDSDRGVNVTITSPRAPHPDQVGGRLSPLRGEVKRLWLPTAKPNRWILSR